MTVESALGRGREERQRFVDRLLAALPGPGEAPVSTNEIGAAFSLGPYERSVLWSVLDKLTRAGLVERVVVDGELVRYWRRSAAAPTDCAHAVADKLG